MGLGAVGANGEEGRKRVRLTREAQQPGTGVRYLKGLLFSIDLRIGKLGGGFCNPQDSGSRTSRCCASLFVRTHHTHGASRNGCLSQYFA